MLDMIVSSYRLGVIESKCVHMETAISDVKKELGIHNDRIESSEFQYAIIEDRLGKVEAERYYDRQNCLQLQKKILEDQSRSMRNKLRE